VNPIDTISSLQIRGAEDGQYEEAEAEQSLAPANFDESVEIAPVQ
jgi:hypothetical protein